MTTPIITKATNILREGGLVAFPTETVYGLGADAANPDALQRIFAAKERPYNHPLIVHISAIKNLNDWAREVPETAIKLAHAFWPGPLTLILKKQPHVSDLITSGQDTIGLRIPKHPVALQLLQAFAGGIAAPSANRFTHISPTTAMAVQEELGGKIDLILEGGLCEVGLESTIIDVTRETPVILRPGMISAQAISALLGMQVALAASEAEIRAPGMHHLHYAPNTAAALIAKDEVSSFLQINKDPVAIVIYSEMNMPEIPNVHWVKLSDKPAQYAHDIYQSLRSLDHQQFKRILIERVPDTTEWDAIRDRLLKATGGRK